MQNSYITNIQKYSIHDGDGIRTTVFFKGCPLKCSWCHNPETQIYEQQLSLMNEKCINCNNCIAVCPVNAIKKEDTRVVTDFSRCKGCSFCADACYFEARQIIGRSYLVEELILECEKDLMFYEQSNGGVTLSGGEVMSIDSLFLTQLLKGLFQKGIRINIDTCGYANLKRFEEILPYIDTFLYDLKIMDAHIHKKWTGVDNLLILDNLKWLSKKNAKIWIRLPIIGGVNDTKEHMLQVIHFLREEQIHFEKINLIPYHKAGTEKYERLGMKQQKTRFEIPSEETLLEFMKIFQEHQINHVQIGG